MKLGMEVGLGPGCIELDGDPAPLPLKGGTAAPNFQSMYCDQTAGWIEMALGTEVGLGPGHIALDGDPALTKRGANPHPNLRPMSVVAKRLDGSRCYLVRS